MPTSDKTTTLPPIGPCAECGVEIDYSVAYTVTADHLRRHTSCTQEHHWTDDKAENALLDTAGRLSWQDRIDNYARVVKLPVYMAVGPGDRLFGIWNMGNDYRVRSGYYGGYPATYLRRVRSLFPEKTRVLHLFSGKIDLAAFPGDTVDVNPDLDPTYIDDAQTLERVPLEQYDLVLADPPYSVEDAEHYQTTMVKRNIVMRALARLHPGAHIVWLDQVKPMYSKNTFDLIGEIGMSKSTNHRYRVVTFFRRSESNAE